MRALFVNENIGGHAAMHLHIRRALEGRDDVQAEFVDVPPPRLGRRLVGARVPGLARFDLDLQPIRAQLAASAVARRLVQRAGEHDVLHVYSVNAGLAMTDRIGAAPSVVSTDSTNEQNAYSLPYRDATRWTGEALRAQRRLEQRVYDAAGLVVAQSSWTADSLRDHYGLEEDRLRVIPFGLTVPDVPEDVPVPDRPEITFVGTSLARKGGLRLLDVHRRALRGKAVLNLVTRDAVAEEPDVRVFRDFRPGDPRLVELLARTAVFAFPSEIDKSSYAVLEAMACGVPVVTTRLAALPELVGDTGRLVDPGSTDELEAALVELLEDDELRRRLGAAARQRVLERFDARVTTAQLVDVLGEAIGRGPRRPRPGR